MLTNNSKNNQVFIKLFQGYLIGELADREW